MILFPLYLGFPFQFLFIILFASYVDYDYGANGRNDTSLDLVQPKEDYIKLNGNFMASKCAGRECRDWKEQPIRPKSFEHSPSLHHISALNFIPETGNWLTNWRVLCIYGEQFFGEKYHLIDGWKQSHAPPILKRYCRFSILMNYMMTSWNRNIFRVTGP